MAGKRAKMISDAALLKVIEYINTTKEADPHAAARNLLIVLMSVKAGLRACELAGLNWLNVMDEMGALSAAEIELPANIAKKGHARTVPMNPMIFDALQYYARFRHDLRPNDPLFKPSSYTRRFTANNMQRLMSRLYASAGLVGCSSHSGRRAFVTKAIRQAGAHDCSLADVQRVVGHKYIDTTQKYVEASVGINALVRGL